MATIRRIVFISGIAMILAAVFLIDAGNANLGRPSSVRVGLAGAGTVIALGSLMIRLQAKKDGGEAKPGKPAK